MGMDASIDGSGGLGVVMLSASPSAAIATVARSKRSSAFAAAARWNHASNAGGSDTLRRRCARALAGSVGPMMTFDRSGKIEPGPFDSSFQ